MIAINQRLEKEFNDVQNAIQEGILNHMSVQVAHEKDSINYRKWLITIYGKEGTIWEGGEFPGVLIFYKNYPNEPPIYYWSLFGEQFQHMNIYQNGATCLDILNNELTYTPSVSCIEILKGMEGFLYNPNPKSPTIVSLAQIYVTDEQQYNQLIKAFVKHYMLEQQKQKETK